MLQNWGANVRLILQERCRFALIPQRLMGINDDDRRQGILMLLTDAMCDEVGYQRSDGKTIPRLFSLRVVCDDPFPVASPHPVGGSIAL